MLSNPNNYSYRYAFGMPWPSMWGIENEWTMPPPKELHGKTGYEKQNALGHTSLQRKPLSVAQKAAKKSVRQQAAQARKRSK